MTSFALRIRAEAPQDDDAIEQMSAEAFGPGRFARAAFRLREGVEHEPGLSFVAMMYKAQTDEHEGEELVGSVRLTRILIGNTPALVLGPLIVARSRKNIGIGRELMHRCLLEARRAGHRLVILVGDEPYYGKFGFQKVPPGQITMPGPADPARILYCELAHGALDGVAGQARQFVQ